jgi:hypothetical protein
VGRSGTVWITLDLVLLFKTEGSQRTSKEIHAGDAGKSDPGEGLQFRARNGQHGRLVVIKPKTAHQELTISPFVLSDSIEDASDRNATLLVAVSDSRFRDTWNLGDESKWIPSKPAVVVLDVGSVRWMRPGIHHFKNLGLTPARMVVHRMVKGRGPQRAADLSDLHSYKWFGCEVSTLVLIKF